MTANLSHLLQANFEARRRRMVVFLVASFLIAAGCDYRQIALARLKQKIGRETARIIIQSYEGGLAAIRTANPDIKLSLSRDPASSKGRVLLVDYPSATDDPAGRDVWCDAEQRDWTPGRAVSFRVRSSHATRLSVSFLDRNRVAYTHWTKLRGRRWQTVRIAFDQIRPNPYFQPPGAKTGAPIDVSEVLRIGFAPQDPGAGRLAISSFVVVD